MEDSKRFTAITQQDGVEVMETITAGNGVWHIRRWRNGRRQWWGSVLCHTAKPLWEEENSKLDQLKSLLTIGGRVAFIEWVKRQKAL